MSEVKEVLEYIALNSTDKASQLVAQRALGVLTLSGNQKEVATSDSALLVLAKEGYQKIALVNSSVQRLASEFDNLDFDRTGDLDRGKEIQEIIQNLYSTICDLDPLVELEDFFCDVENTLDSMDSALEDVNWGEDNEEDDDCWDEDDDDDDYYGHEDEDDYDDSTPY